jgi:hypothetical protein
MTVAAACRASRAWRAHLRPFTTAIQHPSISLGLDEKTVDSAHTINNLKMDSGNSPLHDCSDGIGEVENTRTIDMSKEQKNVDGEKGHIMSRDIKPVPSVQQGHFRLLDLPLELRNHIYSFLLPYNVIISHKRRRLLSTHGNGGNLSFRCNKEVQWFLHVTTKKNGENVRFAIGRQRRTWKHARVQTQLFLVNKAISSDTQGTLLFILRQYKSS